MRSKSKWKLRSVFVRFLWSWVGCGRGDAGELIAGADMRKQMQGWIWNREKTNTLLTPMSETLISTSCFWLIVSSLRLKMFLVSVWIHRHFKNLTIDISVTFLWNVWHICLRHWYEMWHFRRCKIFSISMQSKTSGLGTQLGSLRSWIKCRIRMKLFAGRASWSWADVLGQVNVDVQLEWSLPDHWKKDGNQGHNLSFIDHNQNISFAKTRFNQMKGVFVNFWLICSIHDKLEFWFQFRLLTGRWICWSTKRSDLSSSLNLAKINSLILPDMLIYPKYQPPRLNFVKISPPTL